MSIMVLIIIALIAYIFCNKILDNTRLAEYISAFSILLSIVLSVFAIQYTYTSNNNVNRQFEKINTAAETISKTSDGLNATNTELKNNLETILLKLTSLDENQSQIKESMKQFENNQMPKLLKNNENINS